MKFSPNLKAVGSRIKELRNEFGYNQLDFSKELSVSKSALSLYERGEREPTISLLYKLNEKFNVDIHWLVTGESQPASKPSSLLDEGILLQVLDLSVQSRWIKVLTRKMSDYIKEFVETYEFLYWKKHKK